MDILLASRRCFAVVMGMLHRFLQVTCRFRPELSISQVKCPQGVHLDISSIRHPLPNAR